MVTNVLKTELVCIIVTKSSDTTMPFKQLRIWVFIIAISSCDCVLFAQKIPQLDVCERHCHYFTRGRYADCRSLGLSEIPIACKDAVRIDFSSNELSMLDNTSLETFTKLEDLTIKRTNLSSISRGVFYSCAQNILRLNLASNSLQTLQTDAFDNLLVLEVLILDENRLSNLENGCLKNLPSLKFLYLNSNNLSSLDGRVFQDCPAVEYLYLNNNRIVQINTHSLFGLNNLKTLYMENNLIMQISKDAFNRTRKLESLILNDNQLSNFNFDVLEFLVAIESLQLKNNQISGIEGTFFSSKIMVELQQNPIICNCSLQGFVESVLTRKLKLNASCAVPEDLANVKITDVNFDRCGHESLQTVTEVFQLENDGFTNAEQRAVDLWKGQVTLAPKLREVSEKLHWWIVTFIVWFVIIIIFSLIFAILCKRTEAFQCNKINQLYWDTNGSHTSARGSTSSRIRKSEEEPIYLEIPETSSSARNCETRELQLPGVETEVSSLRGSDLHEFPAIPNDSGDQPIPGVNRTVTIVNHISDNGIETLV